MMRSLIRARSGAGPSVPRWPTVTLLVVAAVNAVLVAVERVWWPWVMVLATTGTALALERLRPAPGTARAADAHHSPSADEPADHGRPVGPPDAMAARPAGGVHPGNGERDDAQR